MSPVWDNSCHLYFITGCWVTLLWHSHPANSNNGALWMDTKKSGWCCNLPATVVRGQVVMLREYIMHSCKIDSISYLSSFQGLHGNSPGCLEKQDCDLNVTGFNPWNQMEKSGVLKIQKRQFPFHQIHVQVIQWNCSAANRKRVRLFWRRSLVWMCGNK